MNIMNDGFGIHCDNQLTETTDTLKDILQKDQDKIIRQITKTK